MFEWVTRRPSERAGRREITASDALGTERKRNEDGKESVRELTRVRGLGETMPVGHTREMTDEKRECGETGLSLVMPTCELNCDTSPVKE